MFSQKVIVSSTKNKVDGLGRYLFIWVRIMRTNALMQKTNIIQHSTQLIRLRLIIRIYRMKILLISDTKGITFSLLRVFSYRFSTSPKFISISIYKYWIELMKNSPKRKYTMPNWFLFVFPLFFQIDSFFTEKDPSKLLLLVSVQFWKLHKLCHWTLKWIYNLLNGSICVENSNEQRKKMIYSLIKSISCESLQLNALSFLLSSLITIK